MKVIKIAYNPDISKKAKDIIVNNVNEIATSTTEDSCEYEILEILLLNQIPNSDIKILQEYIEKGIYIIQF